jgi:hypothetical protein
MGGTLSSALILEIKHLGRASMGPSFLDRTIQIFDSMQRNRELPRLPHSSALEGAWNAVFEAQRCAYLTNPYQDCRWL